jgi:acetyltransferase-like isoleucine patch superfamily enzyme
MANRLTSLVNDKPEVSHGGIDADNLKVGQGVVLGPRSIVSAINGKADSVAIGDHVHIGNDVRILAPEVYIGDHTVIHNHTTIYGYAPVRLGDCCWVGQNAVINCTAPVWIGDGVTISAYANLWTHFRAGDILQGCRFDSEKPLALGDDVWIGVQCSLAPIIAQRRALVLAGSIVTHDLEENHVYGGNPAVDLTEKLGPQFEEVSLDEKFAIIKDRLIAFEQDWKSMVTRHGATDGPSDVFPGTLASQPLDPWWRESEEGSFQAAGIMVTIRPWKKSDVPVFSVADRTYSKLGTPEETAFMKFLLPQVKFYPHKRPRFAELRQRFEELIPRLKDL